MNLLAGFGIAVAMEGDLFVYTPLMQGSPVTYRETPPGAASSPDLAPDIYLLRLGLVGDLVAARSPNITFLGIGGVRLWAGRWEETFDFQATVYDTELEFGMRFGPAEGNGAPRERLFTLFYQFAAGPHVLVMLPSDWPGRLDFAGGAQTGVGCTMGRGLTRGVAQLRFGFTTSFAEWGGELETTAGSMEWNYHPANLRMDVMVGSAFR